LARRPMMKKNGKLAPWQSPLTQFMKRESVTMVTIKVT
jgi:hypothetical protein